MSMKAGELFVYLGLDDKEYNRGLADAEKQGERTADQIAKSFQAMGDKMQQAGKAMMLALTAPLALVGRSWINMAMDAIESESLFETSMGRMAEGARKWSDQTADALGLNRYELRKNVGVMYTMVRSMGLTEQQAYDMSLGIAQLAEDMASFYNLSSQDAFNKLRSGLAGETEPLKQIGILVNDLTVQQWALNNGWIRQGQTLSNEQKVMARYNVILAATTAAQGDLARTLGSPANEVRAMRAQYDEMAITLGMHLLPIVSKATGVLTAMIGTISRLPEPVQTAGIAMLVLTTALGPLLWGLGQLLTVGPAVIGFFKNLQVATIVTSALRGELAANIPILGAVSRAVGIYRMQMALASAQGVAMTGVLARLRLALYSVWTALGPIGWAILAVSGLLGAGIHLWGKYTQSLESASLGAMQTQMQDGSKSIGDATQAMEEHGEAIEEAGKTASKNLQSFDEVYTLADEMADTAAPDLDFGLGEVAVGSLPELPGLPDLDAGFEAQKPTIAGFWDWLKQYASDVWSNLKAEGGKVWDWFIEDGYKKLLLALGPAGWIVLAIIEGWDKIKEKGAEIWDGIKDGDWKWLLGALGPAGWIVLAIIEGWDKIKEKGAEIWDGIKDGDWKWLLGALGPAGWIVLAIIEGWDAIKTKTKEMWTSTIDWLGGVWDTIEQKAKSIWGGMKESIVNAVNGAKEFVISVWSDAHNWLSGKWDAIQQKARDVWDSVRDTVAEAMSSVKGFVIDTWETVANWLSQNLDAIKKKTEDTWAAIKNAARDAWKGIGNTIIGVINGIRNGINVFIRGLNKLSFTAPSWVPEIGGKSWGLNIPTISQIPALAEGGIVMSPTVALIGEAGPEAVVPLSKSEQVGRTEIHLHVGTLVADRAGLKELERKLRSIRIEESVRLGVSV